MKSVLPLITTAALAGLATAVSIPPSRRQTDSDFFFAEYDLDRPAGPGFETCTDDDCESGTWRAIPDNEGGNDICLDFSANEVGYR
ncbi:hypothetical protein K435DRAFT_781520 [Dendrothele bispora CBS 962.96]|uniref:Small secreted protein n=1 Tax=Dendrothele bispora (strain CBS 962.96) TaxID=1314807 RepID=A0A4S8LK97_DENBC|nr:hypothetical protein K435DRAFT_781520 [Dendrothele bispora CBS 962.96]